MKDRSTNNSKLQKDISNIVETYNNVYTPIHLQVNKKRMNAFQNNYVQGSNKRTLTEVDENVGSYYTK
jgi:hypothetical protein